MGPSWDLPGPLNGILSRYEDGHALGDKDWCRLAASRAHRLAPAAVHLNAGNSDLPDRISAQPTPPKSPPTGGLRPMLPSITGTRRSCAPANRTPRSGRDSGASASIT